MIKQKYIEKYNNTTHREYIPRFQVTKGLLFLDRMDNGNKSKKFRLKYQGKANKWEFAIYRYSTGGYHDDEPFSLGIEEVDDTIIGAMKAGDEAY